MTEQTSLNTKAINAVVNSWEHLKETPNIGPIVGNLIFGKFFQICPKALALYPFENSSIDEMYENPVFKAHSGKVVETFDYIVVSLMDLERDYLVELGERHTRYPGVSPDYFAALGAAVLYALEQGLKDIWDPSLREAWLQIIGFLASSMSEGMDKNRSVPRVTRGGAAREETKAQEEKQAEIDDSKELSSHLTTLCPMAAMQANYTSQNATQFSSVSIKMTQRQPDACDEQASPQNNLSPTDITNITKSWERMKSRSRLSDFQKILYRHYNSLVPEGRSLLQPPVAESSQNAPPQRRMSLSALLPLPSFRKQQNKGGCEVVDLLDMLVDDLFDLDRDLIVDHGRKHSGMLDIVTPQHFQSLQDAVLWTLRNRLGRRNWNDELEGSWKILLQDVSLAMQEGMHY